MPRFIRDFSHLTNRCLNMGKTILGTEEQQFFKNHFEHFLF